ncbi:hypothetical protein NliqN6_1561 [Naganishia liquefaciens]|uniref:Uncharacterized protein n=1 Tax=Naganishia liquefaciens TaxID=104408 RepID=A0A8H3TRZ5_9TREE|nr:hypothetical protein NliqN6_1561 [Naganishia liquefaciens]
MSILIACHPASLAASHALARAITASEDAAWDIDNKYYTARVDVKVRHVDEQGQGQGQGVDLGDAMVVIWAFTDSAHATPPPILPPLLARHPSIDLLYSVRLPTSSSSSSSSSSSFEARFDPETDQDAADTFHAEYINLSSLDDPASRTLKQLQDALQTVPWPTMVRKPLPQHRNPPRASPPPPPREREKVVVEDEGGDEDVDWTREQHALNAWLDADGEAFPRSRQDLGAARTTTTATTTFEDDFHPSTSSPSPSPSPSPSSEEYTPFQSGPGLAHDDPTQSPSSPSDDPFLPHDPSPLIAHLSTIRHHLTTISDADERRTLAAQHVERLFAGLGIDLESGDLEDA